MAVLHGLDPVRFLSAEGFDLDIMLAVLGRAQEIRLRERTQDAEAIGAHVARVLAKAFSG